MDKTMIVEVAKEILGADRISNLEEVLQEWIGKNDQIVSAYVDEKRDRILVVTSNPDAYPEDDYSYKMIRFFPMGDKWQVSVDISGQTAQGMISQLLREMTTH